jgi:hypothetical protein
MSARSGRPKAIETKKETVEHVLGQQMLCYQFHTLNHSSWLKQLKVVEEQLYYVDTIWTAQMLKELLQRSARSRGKGLPRGARVWFKILNTQDLRQNHKVLFIDR